MSKALLVAMAVGFLSTGFSTSVHAYEKSMEYRGGITEIQTTYEGLDFVPNFTLEGIESRYGAKAKAAYIEAVRTGDYYDFRTMTGWWGTAEELDGEIYRDVGAPSKAQELETSTFGILGKYATVQDYLAWCQKEGINPSDTGRYHMDVALGKRPAAREITKAEYLAARKVRESAAQAPAPAAGSDQVEALKTYKGNTAEFNAYTYYTRYADLQTALGPNGDLLLKHYNECGKKENRKAN